MHAWDEHDDLIAIGVWPRGLDRVTVELVYAEGLHPNPPPPCIMAKVNGAKT